MEKKRLITKTLALIAITYVFLVSIKLMGTSFKLLGTDFAKTLFELTGNPFIGLFIGILATALVQSSSVTTSAIVALTATGAISVSSAVPVIMGANIGTSITSTIVSLGHITRKKEFKAAFEVATVHDLFNFLVLLVLFPLELSFGFLEKSARTLTNFLLGSGAGLHFTSPLDLAVKPAANLIKDLFNANALALLLLAIALLFISLRLFVILMRPIAQSEARHKLKEHVFDSPARSFLLGIGFTVLVQSSSVSTSLIVPLAGIGMLTIETLFPYILGANIGTTATALLASLVTGSPAAVTVALEHVLFNTTGSILIWPVRKLPIRIAKTLSTISLRSRVYPLAYISIVFYILPASIIYLFH